MDAIGDDYVFLPGLDYCCGDSHLFLGEINEGVNRAEDVVAAIADFQREAAVLWCPTCQCRFNTSIAPAMGIRREDKFKKYTLWGNLARILEDADNHIKESPFERERIIDVLKTVFFFTL